MSKTGDVVVFQPKVIVTASVTNPETVAEGQEFELSVSIKNTSNNMALKNMTVVISPSNEEFILLDATDTVYDNGFYAGEEKSVKYKLKVKEGLENGQYTIPLCFDYADTKGNTYSATGNARVNINNKTDKSELKMNFDNPVIPQEAQVGEIVNVDTGIQNLSRVKVYNVRAVIEADGLNAMETLFVGEMEPGTSALATGQLTVSGLREGSQSFGDTEGTITYYYEDELGNEFSEIKDISMTILSPFSDEIPKKDETPGQWWTIIVIIIILILGFVITYAIRRRQRKEGVSIEQN